MARRRIAATESVPTPKAFVSLFKGLNPFAKIPSQVAIPGWRWYARFMNISLPKHLKDFVSEQVNNGRFGSEAEVIHSALRQMEESEQEREMRAFESAFREIDRHSPPGEPTAEDLAEIDRVVKAIRGARRERQPA
jgi:putative addiction module CopG family antidote